jgi:hypothetical protein
MPKYSAVVNFAVLEFDANSMSQANDKINTLMDELTTVDTSLVWEDIDWYVRDEKEVSKNE